MVEIAPDSVHAMKHLEIWVLPDIVPTLLILLLSQACRVFDTEAFLQGTGKLFASKVACPEAYILSRSEHGTESRSDLTHSSYGSLSETHCVVALRRWQHPHERETRIPYRACSCSVQGLRVEQQWEKGGIDNHDEGKRS